MRSGAAWTFVRSSWFSQNFSEAHFREPRLAGELAFRAALRPRRHDRGSAVAWMTAGSHPDRLRTLTTISTPHGLAFRDALRADPDQQQRSAYVEA